MALVKGFVCPILVDTYATRFEASHSSKVLLASESSLHEGTRHEMHPVATLQFFFIFIGAIRVFDHGA